MNDLDFLFVEDSINDVYLIKRILKKENLTEKYHWLKDGKEALDYFENEENPLPKVVLLDIKMPKVNGLEVLKFLKENSRTKKMPVVMYSSSLQKSDVDTAYDLGANSYMRKPETLNDMKELFVQIFKYWVLFNKNVSNE